MKPSFLPIMLVSNPHPLEILTSLVHQDSHPGKLVQLSPLTPDNPVPVILAALVRQQEQRVLERLVGVIVHLLAPVLIRIAAALDDPVVRIALIRTADLGAVALEATGGHAQKVLRRW